MENNLPTMIVDLLVLVSLAYRYNSQNPLANGMQRPVPEEISLTPLTNKKQGKKTKDAPVTLVSKPRFALTTKNFKKIVAYEKQIATHI
jgi:hypothetical protein